MSEYTLQALAVCVANPPHFWGQPPVKFVESRWAEGLRAREHERGASEQIRDIHTLTGRRERPQIVGAPGEHVDRPVMVLPLDMIQRDPDLEDALIQRPDRPRFLPPEVFQCLVLLEELAAVELCDPTSQKDRRCLVTRVPHGVITGA